MRRRRFPRRLRPLGVTRTGGPPRRRAAVGVGGVGLLVAVLILVSALLLIGSADAASAGVLRVPVGRITVTVVVGYLVALALIGVAVVSRSAAVRWVAVVLAVGLAIGVSVYPLFATAAVAGDQARHLLPWIADLIARATSG